MTPTHSALWQILTEYTSETGLIWLQDAVNRLQASDDPENDLGFLSGMARRKVGSASSSWNTLTIQYETEEFSLAHWDLPEVARVFLLGTALARVSDRVTFLQTAYRMGDELERVAFMKGLLLLDPQGQCLELAIENGRTNSIPLFSALALYNPYPAQFYTEAQFNQLILKALFLDISIETTLGLETRANPELSRMCLDFIHERQAAKRNLPLSIWLALLPHAHDEGQDLLRLHLADPHPGHRYYASLAVQRSGTQETYQEILQCRWKQETDPKIREVLERLLLPSDRLQ